MSAITDELDALVQKLDAATEEQPQASSGSSSISGGGDAIDAALNGMPRKTAVRRVGALPEVAAFRKELVDGLIRADTANQLLRVVGMLIERMM